MLHTSTSQDRNPCASWFIQDWSHMEPGIAQYKVELPISRTFWSSRSTPSDVHTLYNLFHETTSERSGRYRIWNEQCSCSRCLGHHVLGSSELSCDTACGVMRWREMLCLRKRRRTTLLIVDSIHGGTRLDNYGAHGELSGRTVCHVRGLLLAPLYSTVIRDERSSFSWGYRVMCPDNAGKECDYS